MQHRYPTRYALKQKEKEAADGKKPEDGDKKSEDEPHLQCAICLNDLTTQEIGKPENCDHAFCLTCINEWSKNNNTCPVDRGIYTSFFFDYDEED